jgi:hypothetical protein
MNKKLTASIKKAHAIPNALMNSPAGPGATSVVIWFVD